MGTSQYIIILNYVDNRTEFADFSIVVLNNTVDLNDKISAIKLPAENSSCPEGKIMSVRGWGITWLDKYNYKLDNPSRHLMAAKQLCLDVMNHCSGKKQFADWIICAGDPIDPRNAPCFGDSGGN